MKEHTSHQRAGTASVVVSNRVYVRHLGLLRLNITCRVIPATKQVAASKKKEKGNVLCCVDRSMCCSMWIAGDEVDTASTPYLQSTYLRGTKGAR